MRSLLRHSNYYNLFYFFLSSTRMNGNNIIFNNKKINKINFFKCRKLSKIDDTDVNKILVSKKE